jgi:putative ABC transport system substrate-binding protein
MKRERIEAVIIGADGFFLGEGQHIAEVALRNQVLVMSPWREHVAAGALMSYGQNVAESFRRAATFVDKILKGAKPGDLPFEQPTKIHFAINHKTAKALRLTIPPELLFRADEVVE